MNESLPEFERLRWQCRRGLLELDYLLEAFLEREYPRLDDSVKRDFIALLACDDPDLQRWLLGDQRPADPTLARTVERLRQLRL